MNSMIITTLNSNGLLSQLAEEVVEGFDTGDSGMAVADIVASLLEYQRKDTKITVGTISVTGTRAIKVKSPRTILSVLLKLQESVGGYISVDNDRVLDWATDIGEDKGQQIRYRKNLVGIERTINWDDYCTRLFLSGAEESLSDITIGPVSPTITTDETYAYFTLPEQYAAYYGWTAEGDTLPATFKVWLENDSPAWVDAGGDCSSGLYWDDVSYGSDGNDGTWAEYLGPSGYGIPAYGRSSPFYANIGEGTYNAVKYKLYIDGYKYQTIKIEVYTTEWEQVYYGAPGTIGEWHTKTFTTRACSRVQITGYNTWADVVLFQINEIQLLEADLSDVTDDFDQGEYENVVRCAIGDYNALNTYTIEYQHANYLVAWDKITDNDDIVARIVSAPSDTYSLSLLEYGRLLLDKLKEESYTYSIDCINLAEVAPKFEFDQLELGSIVNVIDEDLGIDVSARVVKISFPDLLNPENMQVEISTRIRDITDSIANMQRLISG
jgi:hypothetical protein